MKKAIVIGLALLLGVALIGYAVADPGHGRGWGMMGPGYGGGWMMRGGSGYGPGWMMQGGPGWMHRGTGYGPGMMGPGFGPGMMGPCQSFWGASASTGEKLTREKAEALVNRHLAWMGNPNLKVGSVKEETDSFVAEIVTKDGSLVDRLRIDKETGITRPIR